MRLPFTPYGLRELLLLGGGGAAAAAALGSAVHPLAALPPALVSALTLQFFRDPERRVPADPCAVVAPADGRVTHVDVVEEPEYLKEPAYRVGIFLSLFNVHVNRAPVAGQVVWVSYRPGRFLNALDPRSLKVNESNWIALRTPTGVPVLLRQVAGAVARRIVCPLALHERVRRGERIGMIKMGSRTECYVPVASGFRPTCRVGERVRGGNSVIGHLPGLEEAG